MKGRDQKSIHRAFVRYYGGKARIADWIISFFPQHSTYVEPYGGAGSVLFRKKRVPTEIYNDIDDEVVNLFRVVRDPGTCKDLQNLLHWTPFSRREFELAYRPTQEPVEKARRFLVRAYMGHGSTGGTHRNKTGFIRGILSRGRGGGHPPSHDWASYPESLPAFCERLRNVTIECQHAPDLLQTYDSTETLFYLDPPYVRSSRKHDSAGYRNEMSDEDHRQLAQVAHSLAGMVVISGYPSDLYTELYQDWQSATRATTADKHGTRIECVWMNAAAYAAMPHRRLEL